ncbi:MAG: RNA polymerase Rpb4 family protein [Thermoplasmatales archaeon]
MKITYIPLSKAKELLIEASSTRELNSVQESALKHLKKFSKLEGEVAERVCDEFVSLGLDRAVAVKIVDIMPGTIDELRAVIYPQVQNLDASLGEKILETLQKSR